MLLLKKYYFKNCLSKINFWECVSVLLEQSIWAIRRRGCKAESDLQARPCVPQYLLSRPTQCGWLAWQTCFVWREIRGQGWITSKTPSESFGVPSEKTTTWGKAAAIAAFCNRRVLQSTTFWSFMWNDRLLNLSSRNVDTYNLIRGGVLQNYTLLYTPPIVTSISNTISVI